MGTCKYCGKDAGLFSHIHKECEEKYNQGISSLEDGIRRYLKDALSNHFNSHSKIVLVVKKIVS